MKGPEIEETYRNLELILRETGPISAEGLSKLLGTKLAATYHRLNKLEERGVKLQMISIRTGSRGPHRTLYSLGS